MQTQLFSMLIELLNKDKVTAEYLAGRLEISIRSVYRYIDKLSLAGIPIRTANGKNGGIMLGQEFKLSNIYLTAEELSRLILSLRHMQADNEELIAKLTSINGRDSGLSQISERFVVEHTSSASGMIGGKINLLEKAMSLSRKVSITYHDRSHNSTQRLILPYNFILRDNEWYIYCYCTLRENFRVFKLSRITNLYMTEETFLPEENYPKNWRFDFDESLKTVDVTLRVTPEARYRIEEWLGIEAVKYSESKDCFIAGFRTKLNQDLIFKLLSFGDGIQVLSPNILKKELKNAVINMNRVYNGTD